MRLEKPLPSEGLKREQAARDLAKDLKKSTKAELQERYAKKRELTEEVIESAPDNDPRLEDAVKARKRVEAKRASLNRLSKEEQKPFEPVVQSARHEPYKPEVRTARRDPAPTFFGRMKNKLSSLFGRKKLMEKAPPEVYYPDQDQDKDGEAQAAK